MAADAYGKEAATINVKSGLLIDLARGHNKFSLRRLTSQRYYVATLTLAAWQKATMVWLVMYLKLKIVAKSDLHCVRSNAFIYGHEDHQLIPFTPSLRVSCNKTSSWNSLDIYDRGQPDIYIYLVVVLGTT